MSFAGEINAIKDRLGKQIERMSRLMSDHGVDGLIVLVKTYSSNAKFRSEWNDIWMDIAKKDGGKLSLVTIGLIIGASLGRVGIAAMGGAIGLPLALILGLGGLVAGTEIDAARHAVTRIGVPQELHRKLSAAAATLEVSVEDFAAVLLESALAEWQ